MCPEQDVKTVSLTLLCLHAEGNSFQREANEPHEPPDKTTLLLAPYASVRGSVAPAGLAGKSTCSVQEETYELPDGSITTDGAICLQCAGVLFQPSPTSR